VTERSEGTIEHSTIGHGGAERQRGGAVTERSEGTIEHSTVGHSGAERQRGGAVTGSMPGGAIIRMFAVTARRKIPTVQPCARESRFIPGRYPWLSTSRSCRYHPENRPAYSWRVLRDSGAHSIFRGLGSMPFGTQCRVSKFARESRFPFPCLGPTYLSATTSSQPNRHAACRIVVSTTESEEPSTTSTAQSPVSVTISGEDNA